MQPLMSCAVLDDGVAISTTAERDADRGATV